MVATVLALAAPRQNKTYQINDALEFAYMLNCVNEPITYLPICRMQSGRGNCDSLRKIVSVSVYNICVRNVTKNGTHQSLL
jgi:hypothetical protein